MPIEHAGDYTLAAKRLISSKKYNNYSILYWYSPCESCRMRAKRFMMPGLVAFLSLGFISQSPVSEVSVRQVSSVNCVDCVKDPVPGVVVPSLIPFMVSSNARLGEDSFSYFTRQVDFQTKLNNLGLINGFSRMFSALPVYPSYAIPAVANYQVSLVKPGASNQIFGGLTADPALKFLTQPGIDARTTTSVATGIVMPTVLDVAAVIEANTGFVPSTSAVISVTQAATGVKLVAPNAFTAAPVNESIVPKSQDRIAATVPSSSLLGSKPVKQPAAPEFTFTLNGSAPPPGFRKVAGETAPVVSAPAARATGNPHRDAVIQFSLQGR